MSGAHARRPDRAALAALRRLEAGSRPTLARLARALRLRHAAHRRAAWSGALADAFAAHLVAITLLGTLSAADPWRRAWLWAALAAWGLYLWPLCRALRARRRPEYALPAVAAALDRAAPEAPDIFRTLLSLERLDAATLDAVETLDASWEPRLRLPPPPRLARPRRVAVGSALAFALLFPFVAAQVAPARFPGGAAEIFRRGALPASVLAATPGPRLTPDALPSEIPAGDSLTVRVRLERVASGRPVYLHVIRAGGETRHAMRRSGADAARFTLGPLHDEATLRFSTPGFTTRAYRVRVLPPPRLRRLAVDVTSPAYTRRPPERHAEAPAVLTVLPGSEIVWRAEAAQSLASLQAEWIPDTGVATLQELGAGKQQRFRQTARAPFALRFRLSDARGGRNVEGPFRVELKADAPPDVVLLEPSGDGDLPRSLRVPVAFTARDDFGIARVTLRYVVTPREGNAREGSVEVTRWRERASGQGRGAWDVSGLGLETGDALELWVEAIDNDAVSGAKTSRTPPVRLKLPSSEEVRAEIAAREREAASSLAGALERERRLRRESERPDRGAQGEALPAPAQWELQRILSEDPRRTLAEIKRHLDGELRGADPKREASALNALRREVEAQEKRLPPPSVATAPAETQRAALERLGRDHRELQARLVKAPRPDSGGGERGNANREQASAERKRLQETLERGLREQQELGAWMAERERAQAAERAREEQAARQAERMRDETRRALEQIERAMEKGLENGALSPELLEKMERVRELLEEVLDADTKQALRESARGEVGAEDLQRAMERLLAQREGVRENLESAIRMLESLKETRALRDLADAMRALELEQAELARCLEGSTKPEAAAAEQQRLEQRLEAARAEMDRLARRPGFRELKTPEREANLESARDAMRRAAEAMQKPQEGERAKARNEARQAAQRLRKAAEQMEKTLAKMEGASDATEVRAALGETLEFSRWIESLRDPRERKAWGGEAGARESGARVARWLSVRLRRLADRRPFDSDVLRREASALGAEADALAAVPASDPRPGALEGARRHAQAAARELLKWMNDDSQEGGSDPGDGEGEGSGGGGDQGEAQSEGLSGRMKGASARQNAVNRATQELLESFLRQRQAGSQKPSPGETPAAGEGGARPRPGSGPGGASGNGAGPEGGDAREGEGAEGPTDARALANRQQRIAESLEQWAEAAEDGGGAARKLRQLAAEARELEAALRAGRLDPESVVRRQERFRTRLLEAANALEERGHEQRRRAEAWRGGTPAAPALDGAERREEWLRTLRRRREEARKLPLPPDQKRWVEWYYEQLPTP